MDFIELAMRGGKMGFDKIIKMIDNLVVELKAEQGMDNDKKAYCLAELDKAEDKHKSLEQDVSDLEKAIADAEESITTLAGEIKALSKSIKDLDKNVAEATSARKAEHDDYVENLAANTAAKDVLDFAKNRLNKFYNPKMYKAPPKRELAAVQEGAAPPPAPEANLAYKKSGEDSNGVIAMIDLLVADIDKDNQVAKVNEDDAQQEYEQFMTDASEKRAQDSKSITDKEGAKAETETELQANKESKKSKTLEAMETAKYIGGLHEECDWLLKNFDARQAARSGEIEALGKAKAVLSGADYSLLQTHSAARLRGSQ
jgi:septal ring factor EnvC (AmiA/AmiB activator)